MASRCPPSLSRLADRCTTLGQISQIHAQMLVRARIPADNYAASRLLSFYSLHHHHLPLALSLLSVTPSPNSFFFNTLIRALALSPSPHLSFSLFSRMLRAGVPPGKHTFPFLLKACSAIKSPALPKQIHSHVSKNGLRADQYVTNSLIHSYSCCGLVFDARKVFDEAHEVRNTMVWTTMVNAYVKNLALDEAILLFEEMVACGVEVCGPTFATVLSACARSGGLETGRRVHRMVVREEKKGINCQVGVVVGTALVDMYAKNGAISEAREVFEGMPERNCATWNAMICGSAHHGFSGEAMELFQEMERARVVWPNGITLTGVLTACCNAGWVDLGREIFGSMVEKYGIEPKVEHYGCMVDLLGRSGRVEEAQELLRGMKCAADLVVWGALLTACKNFGKIEIAEWAVEEMLKLDPDNNNVYVVLSNMYAEAGRWEDVMRVRSIMRDEGIKKTPGWSSTSQFSDLDGMHNKPPAADVVVSAAVT